MWDPPLVRTLTVVGREHRGRAGLTEMGPGQWTRALTASDAVQGAQLWLSQGSAVVVAIRDGGTGSVHGHIRDG